MEDGGLVPSAPWVTGAGDTWPWHSPSACPVEPSVLDGVISFFRRCFFLSTRGEGGGSLPALPGLDTASKDSGDSAERPHVGGWGTMDTGVGGVIRLMRTRELCRTIEATRVTKSIRTTQVSKGCQGHQVHRAQQYHLGHQGHWTQWGHQGHQSPRGPGHTGIIRAAQGH